MAKNMKNPSGPVTTQDDYADWQFTPLFNDWYNVTYTQTLTFTMANSNAANSATTRKQLSKQIRLMQKENGEWKTVGLTQIYMPPKG
jgi:hypothetical protein